RLGRVTAHLQQGQHQGGELVAHGDTGETYANIGTNPVDRERRATHVGRFFRRSEEHTSELQSRENLVCRLLLEKQNSVMAHKGEGGTQTDEGHKPYYEIGHRTYV